MISQAELHNFRVIFGGIEYRFRDLTTATKELDPGADCLIAMHVPDGPLTAAAVLWVERHGLDALLLHAETPRSQVEALVRRTGCSHLLSGRVEGKYLQFKLEACEPLERRRESARARVTLLTSGTTGEPKRVTHTWESLRSSVAKRAALQDARWMSLYPMTRFAGFNALLHAIYNDAVLIVPLSRNPSSVVEEIKRTGPTHVLGTPTMWRNLLMALPGDSGTLRSIRQITLGGEVVDQQILNSLAAAAPHARLTHIYASTEFGVCVAVSDGLAGFPEQWLEVTNRATQLKILHGELWIKRNKALWSDMTTPQDGWVTTNDMVEIRDRRVFIKGRSSDVLNVGGAKVIPAEVEERLLEVPGVKAARVTGRENSISGTIVAAEVVGTSGVNQNTLRAALMLHCRACLPPFAIPRIIAFVDSLPITASGKTSRNSGVGT